MTVRTHNEDETIRLATDFAKQLKAGDIVLLHGDLGAGKTVFCRSLLRTLCNDEHLEVPSPTFTLLQTYDSDKGSISHFDLYRIKDPDEIYELGWEDACADGIVLVEWPERLGHLRPKHYLDICIQAVDNEPDQREIEIKTHGTT